MRFFTLSIALLAVSFGAQWLAELATPPAAKVQEHQQQQQQAACQLLGGC